MPDLLFQNLSTVQSNLQPAPTTLASAATIAPVNFLTYVSGTVAVATIVPPVSGVHMLCLIFNNAAPAALPITGNIGKAFTPVQNVPVFLIYDPIANLYYAK